MSTMVRYIDSMTQLMDQLREVESQYQTAVQHVAEIQSSDGAGQLMYVPAGGAPISLSVTPEGYKTLLEDMTKTNVNTAVLRMAQLWNAANNVAVEAAEHIANAQAKAGVAAAVAVVKSQQPSERAVVSVTTNPQEQVRQPGTTTPLPPRVRRIPGGGTV